MTGSLLYPNLSQAILTTAFSVHSALGCGLPELVYQNALMIEFTDSLIKAESEVYKPVYYKDKLIGQFKADIIVYNKVILELKSVDVLHHKHRAQLLTYLRVTGLRLGYLLNFGGASLEYKRLIL